MNYNKKTVKDFDPAGKRVLLRCDLNVPIDKKTGEITSDIRIMAAVPTIEYLLENSARLIVCSHLGKPKGEIKPELSLKPVAEKLSEILGKNVIFASDTIGPDAKEKAAALEDGDIMLLENLRFDIREEKNAPEFAKELASLADVYVNDAFGTAHRLHASTGGVAEFLPAYSGFLMERELTSLGEAIENPEHPFVSILGGAKVSDKIGVINNLLNKADIIIIGGGMAYTFLKAQGYKIGQSLFDADNFDFAVDMLKKAEKKNVKILLPIDHLVAAEFSNDTEPKLVEGDIPDEFMGMDIGPKTIELFADAIKAAKTVVWNGPMGVFEFDKFNKGTFSIVKALAESDAKTIIGGGDSASAAEKSGFADKISHISTGGGASLELMEGKELPGVACLLDK